jgi:hypothetical protein
MIRSLPKAHGSARTFIRSYLEARRSLAALGILRSERSLQSDYAEWLASKILHIRLARSTVQAGWDAKDRQGRTYQVKSRVVPGIPSTTAFHFHRPLPKFDFLVCVFFDNDLDLLALVKVPRSAVVDIVRDNKRGLRFRWNHRVADDPRIEKVIWPRQRRRPATRPPRGNA